MGRKIEVKIHYRIALLAFPSKMLVTSNLSLRVCVEHVIDERLYTHLVGLLDTQQQRTAFTVTLHLLALHWHAQPVLPSALSLSLRIDTGKWKIQKKKLKAKCTFESTSNTQWYGGKRVRHFPTHIQACKLINYFGHVCSQTITLYKSATSK